MFDCAAYVSVHSKAPRGKKIACHCETARRATFASDRRCEERAIIPYSVRSTLGSSAEYGVGTPGRTCPRFWTRERSERFEETRARSCLLHHYLLIHSRKYGVRGTTNYVLVVCALCTSHNPHSVKLSRNGTTRKPTQKATQSP